MISSPNIFKAILFALSLFAWFSVQHVHGQNLVINEVMYLNEGFLADADGDFHGWIELHNDGSSPVQLNDFYLSNTETISLLWRIPAATLEPGGFVLIFASGKNRTSPDFHTNFKLRNDIDPVLLYRADRVLHDEFTPQCAPINRSVGRLPDGFADIELLSESSPDSTNNIAYADFINLTASPVGFSLPSGFYSESQQVELSTNEGVEIRYTLNSGDLPTWNSIAYQSPIYLTDRSNDPNVFSLIPTTTVPEDTPIPDNLIRKSNVLRAVAMQEGCPVSPVITRNYFVTPAGIDHYPAHVVSVNTGPDALFDEQTGIYVSGENENFVQRGNGWERPAAIEMISPEGDIILAQNAGIRIHGGGTRQGAQKSLRLYARGSYGTSWFDYPFFEDRELDRYKRLILRTSHADWTRTLFKDDLCHSLVSELNVNYQSTLPVVVFLNGEYWGIHNLRERQDNDYLESHFDVDGDEVDIIDYSLIAQGVVVSEGDGMAYNEFVEFIENNDLADDANYAVVSNQMDIANTIDHYIAHLFFANTDFPYNNNSLWREKSTEGIWRWLFFDCDGCMIRTNDNHLFEYLDAQYDLYDTEEWSLLIFRSLMRNSDFARKFAARFQHVLHTTFNAGNVIATINRFEETYAPLVAEHISRWKYPHSLDKWRKDVQNLRSFAMERPLVMSERIAEYFERPFVVYPNPSDGRFKVQFFVQSQLGEVSLWDARGRHVAGRDYQYNSLSSISFDEPLPEGIYLLRVEANGRYYTQRILVGTRQ